MVIHHRECANQGANRFTVDLQQLLRGFRDLDVLFQQLHYPRFSQVVKIRMYNIQQRFIEQLLRSFGAEQGGGGGVGKHQLAVLIEQDCIRTAFQEFYIAFLVQLMSRFLLAGVGDDAGDPHRPDHLAVLDLRHDVELAGDILIRFLANP